MCLLAALLSRLFLTVSFCLNGIMALLELQKITEKMEIFKLKN